MVRKWLKTQLKYSLPPREILVHMVTFLAVVTLFSITVGAQGGGGGGGGGGGSGFQKNLQAITDFISIIVGSVAAANGAYGFLQYMTAGSNVEKDERGRKRIRNTFIGLAGVAVIQGAVAAFKNTVNF